ncbi:hypothetical protein R3P38DRAFT_2787400 [Favolaschia claudopus]|uniref:Uncharacterized protein n=1 Tax=Favolaschia claudopus TaxID=2862362 RepID=A0AAW0APZ2_9AGAR
MVWRWASFAAKLPIVQTSSITIATGSAPTITISMPSAPLLAANLQLSKERRHEETLSIQRWNASITSEDAQHSPLKNGYKNIVSIIPARLLMKTVFLRKKTTEMNGTRSSPAMFTDKDGLVICSEDLFRSSRPQTRAPDLRHEL